MSQNKPTNKYFEFVAPGVPSQAITLECAGGDGDTHRYTQVGIHRYAHVYKDIYTEKH